MDAIRTDNLTKRFGGLTAVDRLTLAVGEGELFGLVGSDGAGKTTTLRMLAGIMVPSDGDVRVLERPIAEVEKIRGDIGYMSQRFGLYPDLTVLENIHFYADIFGLARRERDARLEHLLAFSNLAPFTNRRAGNLSGGMKQKLGLACALIHTPRLLLLDEPTNGVDPVSRRDFWRILYQLLREGVTIVVATAYLDEAERCNRVGLIHQGRLLACAPPRDLKRLMEGTILEVATPQARKAGQLLRERLAGTTVGLFGDRLHVVTRTPEATAAAIGLLFSQERLTSATIRTIEPSLEDVFVSILGTVNATDQPHT